MIGPDDLTVRYPARYGSPGTPTARRCAVCQVGRISARARYCSTACKQHAYRLRQAAPPAADLDALTERSVAQKRLLDNAPAPVGPVEIKELFRDALRYW